MDAVKPFLSIDDQIELLKKRKLTINDDQYEKAKDFLLNNNYYRISGYSLTLRKNNTFFDSASLETLMQIYEADRCMRHVMSVAVCGGIAVKTGYCLAQRQLS